MARSMLLRSTTGCSPPSPRIQGRIFERPATLVARAMSPRRPGLLASQEPM